MGARGQGAVVTGLPQTRPWPEAVLGTLIRAIVHDPNPVVRCRRSNYGRDMVCAVRHVGYLAL